MRHTSFTLFTKIDIAPSLKYGQVSRPDVFIQRRVSLPALNHYQSGTSSHPLNNEIGKQAQQGLFANIHLMLKGNRRDRLGLRVGRERQNLGLIFRSLEMHPGGELKWPFETSNKYSLQIQQTTTNKIILRYWRGREMQNPRSKLTSYSYQSPIAKSREVLLDFGPVV